MIIQRLPRFSAHACDRRESVRISPLLLGLPAQRGQCNSNQSIGANGMLKRLLSKFASRPQETDTEDGRAAHQGLWTDREDAEDVLAQKKANGEISDEEFTLLGEFIRTGKVILKQALDDDLIDALSADIGDQIASGTRRMTYWDDAGHHMEQASREKLLKREAKVLDVHWDSETVQRAIFSSRLSRFLALVFEKPALAFQSLYFTNGSEQSLHQDTAFVYVDSPLELAASWIALEDVHEGSGELVYYPGSHRIDDLIFASGTKALLGDDPAKETYSETLEQRCLEAGLKKETFLPRKGDALIWAADLVHGGAERSTDRTRRSLVTHYCPRDRVPPYLQAVRRHRDKRIRDAHGGNAVSSQHAGG